MDINDNKPFAEPASQLDPTMSVLTEARVLALFDHEFGLQDLEVTDGEIMLFALSIETEVLKQLSASRCRAQGGITNDSKGLPTSAEGKDSERLDWLDDRLVEQKRLGWAWFNFTFAVNGSSARDQLDAEAKQHASFGKDTDKEATK